MLRLSVRAATFAAMAFIALSSNALHAQDMNSTSQSIDDALLAQLQQTRVDADYVAEDFARIIQDLREQHDLNIHVSWSVLGEMGVRRDDRLEIRLCDVTLATLFGMILKEAGGADQLLGYTVEGGVLVISSARALTRNTIVRTYDITDLIESGYSMRRFANTPVLGLDVTGREFVGGEKIDKRRGGGGGGFSGGGGGGGGGGRGGSVFDDPSDQSPRRMERLEEIAVLLMDNIEPNSWIDIGGDSGSMRIFNNTLIIRQTLGTHERIRAFMQMLRSTRPQAVDAEVIIVRLRADKADQWRERLAGRFPRLNAEDLGAIESSRGDYDVLFRANSSGFNGQAMLFSALTQRDLVTGAIAHVNENINAFSPIGDVRTRGIELVVLPLLSAEQDEMTLDVQMAWIPEIEIEQRGVVFASPSTTGTIDRAQLSMRTVSSTTQLQADEAIVLSIPHELDQAGLAAEWEDWLIVRVHRPTEAD